MSRSAPTPQARWIKPYEHRTHGLLPWRHFLRRAGSHLLGGVAILACVVGVGTVGYHTAGHLEWIDAFLNASMILSGMGPVDRMGETPGKLFSAFYALFSGLIFIGIVGVVLAPWVHRLFHWMHLEETGGVDR
jgi:hypothetical protein